MDRDLLNTNSRYSEKDYLSRGRYKDAGIRYSMASASVQESNMASAASNINDAQTHGSYKALILHPNWKLRRKEVLLRDRNRCINCGGTDGLQVHHRQYHFSLSLKQFKAPWDYPDNLLITLCTRCHTKGHSKFKVPIVKIK